MAKTAYIILFGTISLILDILCRTLGIFTCFTAVFICSCVKPTGLFHAITASVISGAMLDLTFGYMYSFTIFTFMALAALMHILNKHASSHQLLANAAIGGGMPILLFVPQILFHGSFDMLMNFMPNIFLSIILTGAYMPCAMIFFDATAEKLDLTRSSEEETFRHG